MQSIQRMLLLQQTSRQQMATLLPSCCTLLPKLTVPGATTSGGGHRVISTHPKARCSERGARKLQPENKTNARQPPFTKKHKFDFDLASRIAEEKFMPSTKSVTLKQESDSEEQSETTERSTNVRADGRQVKSSSSGPRNNRRLDTEKGSNNTAKNVKAYIESVSHDAETATENDFLYDSSERGASENIPGGNVSNAIGKDSSQPSKKIEMKEHPYNNIYTWSTKEELVDLLIQSRVYEDDHILALVKPYGLGQVAVAYKNPPVYGRKPTVWHTMEDVMPMLQVATNCQKLDLVIAPEKWNSGVMVFSKKGKVKSSVIHSQQLARQYWEPSRAYWAITATAPRPASKNTEKVATKMEHNKLGDSVPIIALKPSKTQVSRGNLRAFLVNHDTLAVDEGAATDAALVKVCISSRTNNSLRVWLSHFLAIPLGDHLFGGRVAMLMGVPVPVPYSRAASKQTLSYEFLSMLDLKPSTQELLPLMIHMRSVTLPEYHHFHKPPKEIITGVTMIPQVPISEDPVIDPVTGRDTSKDLVITAPVPQHFQWTLEKLGLKMP